MRMSAHNRVIWSEGLFLQPQHFQQQERYFERYVEARCQPLVPHSWGFTEIEFEPDFLSIGKVGAAARGGRVSRRHAVPDARRRSAAEADRRRIGRPRSDPVSGGAAAPLGRARSGSRGARQTSWCGTTCASCRRATTRRAAESRRCSKWARCARGCCWRARSRRPTPACRSPTSSSAARIDRWSSSESFIPTVLHVRAADRLAAFTTELLGLLHQRGEALAGRVAATGRGAAAEFAEFLMLQAINRYEPLLAHYAESGRAASRAAVRSLRRRRRESWRPSPPPRSGRRSSRPIGTSACASRSNR